MANESNEWAKNEFGDAVLGDIALFIEVRM